tara:strand:+ start:279 stop:845 length:567 start_codon:yes stop_codon:yes gene_type:complete
MNNYIQIYKDVLDPDYCNDLIHRFEKNKEHHEINDKKPMSFTQINFNKHSEYKEDVVQLSNLFNQYVTKYIKDCDIHRLQWPTEYTFESIRLKRYLANDKDEFGAHVDSINAESSRRFLVFFIYLDDNEKGETDFPQLGLYSPCKQGSMLMFPPLWPWIHAGIKPVKKPKYILGSYLLYTWQQRLMYT